MKKKKMTADNVEQLMEIVRAIQQGEDPDEALRKKQAESAPLADSPKSRPGEGEPEDTGRKKMRFGRKPGSFLKKSEETEAGDNTEVENTEDDNTAGANAANANAANGRVAGSREGNALPADPEDPEEGSSGKSILRNGYSRLTGKKKDISGEDKAKTEKAPDDEFEDDDFERILAEDSQKGIDFSAVFSAIAGFIGKISDLLESRKQKKAEKPKRAAGSGHHGTEDEDTGTDKAQNPGTVRTESLQDKEEVLFAAEGAHAEKAGVKDPGMSAADNDETEKPAMSVTDNGETEKSGLSVTEKDEMESPVTSVADNDDTENIGISEAEDTEPGMAGSGAPVYDGAENGKTEDEKTLDRILNRDDLRISKEQTEEETDGPGQPEKAAEEKKAGRSLRGMKEYIPGLKNKLQQKGISRREMFMIGCGLLLVVVIILMIVNSIAGFLAEKKKQEHVTADADLIVTVEKEPEQWCSHAAVELKFRMKGDTVTRAEINGVSYTPDENGMITVQADTNLLEAVAETGQGTRKALIEIPMIDSQAPVVNVARVKDQITVSAADARSEVEGIYYAAVHTGDYNQLPLYQKYNATITYEEDTIYYFYAQDVAGNRSSPVRTTTEAARSLTLSQEKLSLYPGETGYLELQEEPEGALLNNLVFESANEEVVTVTGTGAVTAVGEGSTIIKVSADGVETVACEVEVSETRNVTISTIGDCTLGSDISFNTTTSFDAFDAINGHSYFFSNVREILQNDDATFANLEGTLTTESTRESKQYAFRGDPSYTEVLTSGSVDVVTLANNHSSDYGEKSLTDTENYLKEAGIDYCKGDTIAMKSLNGIQTAFIGIYVLNDGMARETQVKETIAAAKSQGARLVIVAFHWGTEKVSEPDGTQQSLAHTAIDCGADLVVGHHPHVLSAIEKYNGKYIVYSLGNFCFGGNSAPSDMDTIIFRQTFSVTRDSVEADDQVEVIPCRISSADGYNNYQPTPAQGAEADRIIQRVNEYSASFGQTFTASTGLE